MPGICTSSRMTAKSSLEQALAALRRPSARARAAGRAARGSPRARAGSPGDRRRAGCRRGSVAWRCGVIGGARRGVARACRARRALRQRGELAMSARSRSSGSTRASGTARIAAARHRRLSAVVGILHDRAARRGRRCASALRAPSSFAPVSTTPTARCAVACRPPTRTSRRSTAGCSAPARP